MIPNSAVEFQAVVLDSPGQGNLFSVSINICPYLDQYRLAPIHCVFIFIFKTEA